MFFAFLNILTYSQSFLAHILIDGHNLQSFATSKYEYFIQVPYSKNSITIKALTNDNQTPIIYQRNKQKLLNSNEISLTGFDTILISTNSRDPEYKIHFLQVPPTLEPIKIDTTKRLTPVDEPKSPLINSPSIVGTLPNSPFQHYISTSGEKPIKFHATEGLPSTLSLDEDTGIITGQSPSEKGEYTAKITATNLYGSDDISLRIVVGDKQRLTPVQGWSSWYTQSQAIAEDGVLKMAESAVSTRIHDYGFTYINIDDCWQGPRNSNPPYPPQGKKPFTNNGVHFGGFTDFLNLTKYLHSLGLKAGIYSGPKLSTYAGFLGSSSYNESGMDYIYFSPNNGNDNSRGPKFDETGTGSGSNGNPGVYQPSQFYGSYFSGYETAVSGKEVGPYWFGDIDIKQFADWGFDFMKWDWLLYQNVTLTNELTRTITSASVSSGRSMALSLSNNVGHNRELMQSVKSIGATMARITTDIQDNWFSLSAAASEALYYIDFAGDGFYPDPDMLQIGYLGTPNGLNVNFHKTHLSANEQYFQVSFWAIYPAPMILSCDLSKLEDDDFTLGLIKNREVIKINQDALGIPTQKLNNDNMILVKQLEDGSVAVGLFNYVILQKEVSVSLSDITKQIGVTFPKGAQLRSVWEQKDYGVINDQFTVILDGHQGLLFTLTPIY